MMEHGQREDLYDVASILEMINEIQSKAKLPFFQDILHDTIPTIFTTLDVTDPYVAYAFSPTSGPSFGTCYFRVEGINHSLVHLSLLYPIDIEGNTINPMESPYGLKKTKSKITVPIQNFCSIQCVNPKLINRQIIIIGDK